MSVFNSLLGRFGRCGSAAGEGTPPAVPANTSPPVLSREPTQMSATTGEWTGGPTAYEYRWLVNSALIAGQEGATLNLTEVAAVTGYSIVAESRAQNATGWSEWVASSAYTCACEALNVTPPSIDHSGLLVGDVLTAIGDTWSGHVGDIQYTWLLNDGQPSILQQGSSPSYVIAESVAATQYSVGLTARAFDGTFDSAPVSSTNTVIPAPLAPPLAGELALSITYDTTSGYVLYPDTAAYDYTSGNPSGALTYQWYEAFIIPGETPADTPIEGETAPLLTVYPALVPMHYRLVMTSTNSVGTASVASNQVQGPGEL